MERRKGTIINMAPVFSRTERFLGSLLSLRGGQGRSSGVYQTSREGAGPYGITVNAISPGTIATDRVVKLRGKEGLEKIAEAIRSGVWFKLRMLPKPSSSSRRKEEIDHRDQSEHQLW